MLKIQFSLLCELIEKKVSTGIVFMVNKHRFNFLMNAAASFQCDGTEHYSSSYRVIVTLLYHIIYITYMYGVRH